MRRRELLKAALAGAGALAAPAIVRAEGAETITFVPQGDLVSLDPVWTTADVTRNYALAVYDTLYGYDARFKVEPQMVEGHKVENDGREWELTLRPGLKFHDGERVLARDCVESIARAAKRDPMGAALVVRTDEMAALDDRRIRFRLKRPFALLPDALAQVYCPIMPERLAKTDAFEQVKESVGSGPFRFVAAERRPGARVVFERNPDYVPRDGGSPSFTAGPKTVHVERVVWTLVPDPGTAAAALDGGEVDWWENPQLDLVPLLKRNPKLSLAVKDKTGEIGCLRFNHLHPPFDNPAIRRVVATAIDQREVMTAVAGAEPSLIRADVGIFVPGSPMANDVGIEATRGPKDYGKLKAELAAAGYRGERVVVLAAVNYPSIFACSQVACDALQKIGMNLDVQAIDWGTVVQRRTSKEPPERGGWNIFFTLLGTVGNVIPGASNALRMSGASAWFGWPSNPEMEALREAWFDATDAESQRRICRDMQTLFWQDPPYVPLGMFDLPTAFRTNIRDIPEGYPQFYRVKKG